MKSEEECVSALRKWFKEGIIGNIIFYHAPGASVADCIIERVVKAREMEPSTRTAFEIFMDDLSIDRGEVARNSDGKPDRVKLTRRFDG